MRCSERRKDWACRSSCLRRWRRCWKHNDLVCTRNTRIIPLLHHCIIAHLSTLQQALHVLILTAFPTLPILLTILRCNKSLPVSAHHVPFPFLTRNMVHVPSQTPTPASPASPASETTPSSQACSPPHTAEPAGERSAPNSGENPSS